MKCRYRNADSTLLFIDFSNTLSYNVRELTIRGGLVGVAVAWLR
jgi:hypothetical protein